MQSGSLYPRRSRFAPNLSENRSTNFQLTKIMREQLDVNGPLLFAQGDRIRNQILANVLMQTLSWS